jgi:PEP-CTERM motif-containing protein
MKPVQIRRMKVCVAAFALATIFLYAGAAQAVIINFDTLLDNSPVVNGTLITHQYAPYVTFASPAPAGGPIAGAFASESSSPPNVLLGLDPSSGGGFFPIVMTFEPSFSTDSVAVTLISVGSATVTATAFAKDQVTVLDTESVTHGDAAGVGLGNKDPIILTGAGIGSLRFEITKNGVVPDGFAIDDVVFSALVVPEPSSSLALFAGLFACSIYVWRRKRSRAV